MAHIDRLLDFHTEAGVAHELNRMGLRSGMDQPFRTTIVHNIRVDYGLRPRADRLRGQGLVPLNEAARSLGMHPQTVKRYRRAGLLSGEPLDSRGEYYYRIPDDPPRKPTGRPPGGKNNQKSTPPQKRVNNRNHPGGAV